MVEEYVGLYSDLSRKVIGVFYAVHKELGTGFLESVYGSAMALALRQAGLRVAEQSLILVQFRGSVIGTFRSDLLVNSVLLLELKVADKVTKQHEAQLLNYLRATQVEVDLILAFGDTATVKRLYMPNSAKSPIVSPVPPPL